ncbi:MAG: energy-coupling factor transporter transmembrane component T [Clostridium sp.]
MNPFLKILLLTIVTLIVSLDFFPFLSGTLIIMALVVAEIFTTIGVTELLKSVKAFILMSCSFMLIIILARFISGEELALLSVIGLGFKILTISIYSAIFVKTTDPTEFVISLVKYLKVPSKFAYAFLTAYRFLPTFKEEFETIRHAHLVRGIEEGSNFIVRTWRMKQYILPMLATAVRKGIRISMAMETRAFGKYKSRTYYRRLSMKKNEIIGAGIYACIIVGITYFYYINNLTNFGLKYMGG